MDSPELDASGQLRALGGDVLCELSRARGKEVREVRDSVNCHLRQPSLAIGIDVHRGALPLQLLVSGNHSPRDPGFHPADSLV